MNKNLLFAIVAIIIVVAGYLLFSGNNKTPTPTTDREVTPTTDIATPTTGEASTPDQTTVTLSEQNDSGESGTATLVEENGQVTVTLSIQGYPAETPQPAHIHVGTCPDVEAVKYPLSNVVNGESTTTLDVTLSQLENELPLGINVHKSAAEVSVYTACGDLQF